ncbi:MAG: aromatic acid exporter family protein [Eubacteriales bacterium]|nr:aromatic acid exporter family protein [Eubacteriales bacterium]
MTHIIDEKTENITKARMSLPHLGMRIVKTAVAVFLCFMIYILRGYRGLVIQSAIASIICMQPQSADTRKMGLNRMIGMVTGGIGGLIYLLLMRACPVLSANMVTVYLVMAVFVVLVLYSTVITGTAASAALSAIVFLCVVYMYPDIQDPVVDAFSRVLDTFIGFIVAMAVNAFHLPRRKQTGKIFIVHLKDIAPDRFAQIPSALLTMLNRLYADGARICLVSRWAPAFIIPQIGLTKVNTPMIIMDGAGLYNIEDKSYMELIDIDHGHARELIDLLGFLGYGCAVYTVRNNTMFIYHSGKLTEQEEAEYQRMRKSPYRNYMRGDFIDEDRICFMRVAVPADRIKSFEQVLLKMLPDDRFRIVERSLPGFGDYSGLYFYSPDSGVEVMKKRLTAHIRDGEYMTIVDVDPVSHTTDPARDGLQLLAKIHRLYEPVSFG